MKRILIFVLAVCAAPAQLARVGDINFYGLRTVTAEQVLGAAQLAPGGSISRSRVDLEDLIAALPDVVAANVQTLCCEGDRATVFIGIQERGEPDLAFHAAPSGTAINLPEELMAPYRDFQSALQHADLTGTPPAAGVRHDLERLQAYAAGHTVRLRSELHNNGDAEQRAAAAAMMRYAVNKAAAITDLLFALQDPDGEVRMSAAQSLTALATLGRQRPALGIRIPPSQLVGLLNSVVLSDRMEATRALLALTEHPNAAAFDLIRKQALAALAEMARWKTTAYAQPPFRLLGRVAGIPDAEVNQAWEKGDREAVIRRALDAAGK